MEEGLDVIILSGTNPYRPVLGEACKGLLDYKGEPMVYRVMKAFAGLDYINSVIVVGPKKRLEDRLKELIENDKNSKKYVFANETTPGDAECILENGIIGLNYISDKNNPWVLYSSCDIPKINREEADSIVMDLVKSKEKGINEGNLADIYASISKQDFDFKQYKGLSMRDRPGAVLSKDLIIRIGSVHLVNYKSAFKAKEKIIEALRRRKFKDHPIESFFYVKNLFGEDGLKNACKLGLNYIKTYYWLPFYEIKEVPLSYFEERISKGIGINVKCVITKGSNDVDNTKEYQSIIKVD